MCVLDKRYLRSFTMLSLVLSKKLAYHWFTLSLTFLLQYSPSRSLLPASSWTRSSDFCFVWCFHVLCVLQITDWGRDLPKKKIIITAHVPFRYPYSPALPSAVYFSLSLSLSLFNHPPTAGSSCTRYDVICWQTDRNCQMTSRGKARAPKNWECFDVYFLPEQTNNDGARGLTMDDLFLFSRLVFFFKRGGNTLTKCVMKS